MKMYDDYEKLVSVISSCLTSRQNTTAYRMVWNFHKMYQNEAFSSNLFRLCDENLIDLCQR